MSVENLTLVERLLYSIPTLTYPGTVEGKAKELAFTKAVSPLTSRIFYINRELGIEAV